MQENQLTSSSIKWNRRNNPQWLKFRFIFVDFTLLSSKKCLLIYHIYKFKVPISYNRFCTFLHNRTTLLVIRLPKPYSNPIGTSAAILEFWPSKSCKISRPQKIVYCKNNNKIIEHLTIYFIMNLVNIFFVPDFITANMNGAVCIKLFSRNHVTHVKNGRG